MKKYKFFYTIDLIDQIYYSFDNEKNINSYPSYEDMMEDGIRIYGPDDKGFQSDLAEMEERLYFPYMEIIEEEVLI